MFTIKEADLVEAVCLLKQEEDGPIPNSDIERVIGILKAYPRDWICLLMAFGMSADHIGGDDMVNMAIRVWSVKDYDRLITDYREDDARATVIAIRGELEAILDVV